MKCLLSALAVMTIVSSVSAIAADVGVSVQVGEPGFYGRIDIGKFPQPQVICPRPVIIEPCPWEWYASPSTYVYLQATRSTGIGTVANTTHAATRSTSCRIAGTTRSTFRTIVRATAGAMLGVMTMTMTRATVMAMVMETAGATGTIEAGKSPEY